MPVSRKHMTTLSLRFSFPTADNEAHILKGSSNSLPCEGIWYTHSARYTDKIPGIVLSVVFLLKRRVIAMVTKEIIWGDCTRTVTCVYNMHVKSALNLNGWWGFVDVCVRKWRGWGARNGFLPGRDIMAKRSKVLVINCHVLLTNNVMCSILCNLKLTRRARVLVNTELR